MRLSLCALLLWVLFAGTDALAERLDEGVDLDDLKEWKGQVCGVEATVRYVKAKSKVLDRKMPLGDTGFDEQLAVETELDSSGQKYRISFSPDPSNDAHFTIWRVNADGGEEWAHTFGGLGLAIPGNGYVYTWGHTNNYFNERRKFRWIDGKPEEVSQPFQYVGLKTKTLKPITLYADRDYKDIVTRIPAGNPIEVLIGEDKELLIKSPAELVGWMKYEDAWIEKDGRFLSDPSIEGVYYTGD